LSAHIQNTQIHKHFNTENPPYFLSSTSLLTLLAFFTGFGGIALVYLIMALVIPEQTDVQPK